MNQDKSWRGHPLFWAGCYLILSAAFTALFYANAYGLIDQLAFYIVSLLHTPALTFLMKMVTSLGGESVLTPLGVMLIIYCFIRKKWIEAFIILLTLSVGNEIQELTKDFFARPRPTGLNLIEMPDSFAFPSGHAMVGVAFYGMLAYMLQKNYANQPWTRFVTPFFAVLLFLICSSRVYLGVHYLSDVIAGVSYSAVWYCVVRHLYDTALKRWRTHEQTIKM